MLTLERLDPGDRDDVGADSDVHRQAVAWLMKVSSWDPASCEAIGVR